MRFTCQFEHKDTGERKAVVAALSSAEVSSINAIRVGGDDAELFAEAFALKHAYREVPDGFLHVEQPELVRLS
jgi:hypothetical protein